MTPRRAAIGRFPYQSPSQRGKDPANVPWKIGEIPAEARPEEEIVDAAAIGGRQLIIDNIGVSNSAAVVILEQSTFARRVKLRARGGTVTVATQANVAANQGWALGDGEDLESFILPPNARLYGIASAASVFLARVIQG